MPRLELSKILVFISCIFACFSEVTLAIEPVEVRVTERNTKIFAGPEFSTLKFETARVSAYGINLGINYSISRSWGVGGAIRQAFSSNSDYAALFSAFDFWLSFTLYDEGGLDATFTQNGTTIIKMKKSRSTMVYSTFGLSQYFFNSSSDQVYPFSGIGAQLILDIPFSESSSGLRFGLGLDRVSNSKLIVIPIRAQAAIYRDI